MLNYIFAVCTILYTYQMLIYNFYPILSLVSASGVILVAIQRILAILWIVQLISCKTITNLKMSGPFPLKHESILLTLYYKTCAITIKCIY